MFGYVPGAFTGAGHRKQGWFEAAHGGTIFLDEIGETSAQLQIKMLRVLQNGEYAPVGASKNSRCDVRVVAATNQDLTTAVKAGAFRADLYYRLDVIRIHIPPLRERKDDIPLLARQFVVEYARRYHMPVPPMGPGFIERLMLHDRIFGLRPTNSGGATVSAVSPDTAVSSLRPYGTRSLPRI